MLMLKEIKRNNAGQIQECFTTCNPRIKNVIITYTGQEHDLDGFLKSLILDYGRNQKIIV